MKGSLHLLAFVCFFLLASFFIAVSAGAQTGYMKQWPQFRGPFVSGSGSDSLKMGLYANPSPATDGRYVVTFFGSDGLYCYDFNGKLVWTKEFLDDLMMASPAISDDMLFFRTQHYLVAMGSAN